MADDVEGFLADDGVWGFLNGLRRGPLAAAAEYALVSAGELALRPLTIDSLGAAASSGSVKLRSVSYVMASASSRGSESLYVEPLVVPVPRQCRLPGRSEAGPPLWQEPSTSNGSASWARRRPLTTALPIPETSGRST
ncbi:hypothetical protein ACFPJ1_09695 [Kribbella qitaiheensis]|uniref:hypothetical protein n=1 Tax=Kribbella qitaiheensis TaxID=1544730 RepID=UPI003623F38C